LVYLFAEKMNDTPQQDFAECIASLFDNTAEIEEEPVINLPSEGGDETSETQQPVKSPKQETATKTTPNQPPKILFSYFYSHLDSTSMIARNLDTSSLPSNLSIVGGSRAEVDFDYHVSEAERIFRTICPNDEFMPRPPDPEDIIFDGEEKKEEKSGETVNVTEAAREEQTAVAEVETSEVELVEKEEADSSAMNQDSEANS
jgi:hypothetical protein